MPCLPFRRPSSAPLLLCSIPTLSGTRKFFASAPIPRWGHRSDRGFSTSFAPALRRLPQQSWSLARSQIVAEQQPFIYLVNKDAMSAVSPAVVGSAPSVLDPHAFWNAEVLRLGADPALGAQK